MDAFGSSHDFILREYAEISKEEPGVEVMELSPHDAAKNRWCNIVPVAATRVRLGQRPGKSDYINANFVSYGSRTYICTQGPLAETCCDFWQMAYEQNSSVIVMLCNLVEKQRHRCHKYWPKLHEAKRYGEVVVRFVKSATMPGMQLRKFHLFYVGNAREIPPLPAVPDRVVTQLHYTEWPDFGTPGSTLPIRNLCDMFNHYTSAPGAGPGIIHCSAGIGRTGSFVAIHAALTQLFMFGSCSVREITRALRRQRVGMIQTAEQYRFVYQTLKDTILALPNVHCKRPLDSSGEVEGTPLPMETDDVTEMLITGRTFHCIAATPPDVVFDGGRTQLTSSWIQGQ